MNWTASLECAVLLAILVIGLIVAATPGKPRNRRRQDVLPAPSPSCQRNYVP